MITNRSPADEASPSHTFGVDLAILGLDQVRPHEIPDPGRVGRLGIRLVEDGTLRDPIMVARVEGVKGFVLLDGTNRRMALQNLNCRRVLAQIVDYEDRHCVNLLTWSHLVDMSIADVLQMIGLIQGIDIEPIGQDQTDKALGRAASVAAVHSGEHSWLVSRSGKRSKPDLLLDLVEGYEECLQREARDEELISDKLQEVRSRPGGHDSVLVTFPRITRQQVVDLALSGTLIPAGITRHVIRCGRALRVDVPLEWLGSGMPMREAEIAFQNHLAKLRPRRYLEPTVLFDS